MSLAHSKPSAFRLFASATMVAVAVAGCHEKTPPFAGATTAAPVVSAQTQILARPSPPTSQQLADTLKTTVGILPVAGIPYGFETTQKELNCDIAGGAIGYSCGFAYTDGKRNGHEADLKFLVFNNPADMNTVVSQLDARAQAEPGVIKASATAHIDATQKGPDGQDIKIPMPMQCRQARGEPNGNAVCVFQPDPRVVVVSVVTPNNRSYTEDTNDADDVDRAQSMAFIGYTALAAANFSSVAAQPASARSPAPERVPNAIRFDTPSADPVEAEARARLLRRIQEITGYDPAPVAR